MNCKKNKKNNEKFLKNKIKSLEKINLNLKLKIDSVLKDEDVYKVEKEKSISSDLQDKLTNFGISSNKKIHHIESFTGDGVYKVDLKKISCSCPSFIYNNYPHKNKKLEDDKFKCKHLNYCQEIETLKNKMNILIF